MQNKAFRFGPQYLALNTNATPTLPPTVANNILSPGTLTGGVWTGQSGGGTFGQEPNVNLRIILRHVRVVNTTNTPQTFWLFIGATGGAAGGTEFGWYGYSIPANSFVDWYGYMPLDATGYVGADFLTGCASAATALTIQGEGELGVV